MKRRISSSWKKNNQQTDIVVVDEDQQLLSDAASFKLLTLLQETIKADLAKKITLSWVSAA